MERTIDYSVDEFILKPHEYKRDINTVGQYIEQTAQYLSIMEGIPFNEAATFVKENIKSDGLFPLNNPMVDYIRKDENDDRVEDRISLLSYLQQTIRNRDIFSATYTTFCHPSIKTSYLVEYVDNAIPRRKKMKHLQFEAKQKGDTKVMQYANNRQNNIKKGINSISGASSRPSTPIYCASMHPVLTSNCRMTSGYANANNEKLLGGNRHYYSYEVTINNLIALTTRIDETAINNVISKYNLYVPTPEELHELILRSTRLYWRWKEKEDAILEFLRKCSKTYLASIAFTYDLYAMAKWNDSFTREFITKLSTACKPNPEMTLEKAQKIFKSSQEAITNVAIQIFTDDVRGKTADEYSKTDVILDIASTIDNIYLTIDDYKDYIHTFLRTPHLPSSLAKFPSSKRRVVLMSDTDSSIFTVQDWIKWYYGEYRTDSESNKVFSVIVFLSCSTLKHMLAIMSANLGVEEKRIHQIAMKNEFQFLVFMSTLKTKHYMAYITYQEGNVYKTPDVEKKGVHLRNSNSPKEILTHSEKIITDIFDRILEGKKSNLGEILHEIAEEERRIYESVEKGEITYFRGKQIKDKESYKKGEEESPYHKYVFWNNTFGKYYGETQEPPYHSVDVGLSISNKTDTQKWLDSFENQKLADDIRREMKRLKKEVLGTINVPSALFYNRPLPKEIASYVDSRGLIANVAAPYYLGMESVGAVFLDKDKNRLISDYH